jgi:hypothetical protein
MISPGPNPPSLRPCLPGRASYPCVHSPFDLAAAPICTPDYRSQSRFFHLPTTPPLPIHPFGNTEASTRSFPEPQITAFETEQYPLKIDLPAKV